MIDLTGVRIITDVNGSRLSAEMPYPVFDQLYQAYLSTLTKPTTPLIRTAGATESGQIQVKRIVPLDCGDGTVVRHVRNDAPIDRASVNNPLRQRFDALFRPIPKKTETALAEAFRGAGIAPEPEVEALPPQDLAIPEAAPIIEAPPQDEFTPAPKTEVAQVRQRGLPTFDIDVPVEVWRYLRAGDSPIRAWRKYRGWSQPQLAELLELTSSAISHIELADWRKGVNLRPETAAQYAGALDCEPAHLLPTGELFGKAADAHYFKMVPEDRPQKPQPERRAVPVEYARRGTEFPAQVVRFMQGGKSPVEAWRLYRDLDKENAANLLACSPRNFDAFERGENLRPQVIEKLCRLFRCDPEQLKYPIDIEFHGKAKRRFLSPAVDAPAATAAA